MFLKSRATILCMCAGLLAAVLAMPEIAEAQGYNVRRASTVMSVAQYANNAMVNDLTFSYSGEGNTHNINSPSGDDDTLTIKIGYGLVITNDDAARGDTTAAFTLWCGDGYTTKCSSTNLPATISNKGGTGVITVTIATAESFRVTGVRVDASALAVGSNITASVTSTTDASTVGLGGASDQGGVSGVVGKVAAGLKVTATKAADLECSAAKPMPSITVAEGFGMAWGPIRLNQDEVGDSADASGVDEETASIKIVLDNLPDGAKVEWDSPIKSTIEINNKEYTNGTLTLNSAESSSNGRVVVYDYTQVTSYTPVGGTETDLSPKQNATARSFTITLKDTTFKGDASVNISAQLVPMAQRGTDGEKLNLDDTLSFESQLMAPEEGNGEGWLVISECVTYLLYPFVTCGATPGWSTGISVSNTTRRRQRLWRLRRDRRAGWFRGDVRVPERPGGSRQRREGPAGRFDGLQQPDGRGYDHPGLRHYDHGGNGGLRHHPGRLPARSRHGLCPWQLRRRGRR